MSVTPRGMSVQEAYREYVDRNFRVNRQYQRKLVWSTDEKKALIDSILAGYPIPLILLATTVSDDGRKSFEILDGMQRLNAVFGFIENKFDINDRYFDVNQLARARQLAEEGRFVARIGAEVVLDSPACARLLEYTFAITEFPAHDETAVNDVFGRINSYGRRLSDQERRQAGVVTPFGNAVRDIASELRGDASASVLDLSEMPEISIGADSNEQGYGVVAEDTFWCKQGVLRKNQLREAEDEQFVADLAISILEGEPFGFSGGALDEYYDADSDAGRRINAALHGYGVDALKNGIISTISILQDLIEAFDSNSNALRRIVHPDAGGNPIKTGFYAVFMAFFDLCIREGKSPVDGPAIFRALNNLQGRLHVAAGQIRSEPRAQNIAATKGLIQNWFVEKEPKAAQLGPGLMIRFENALRRSKIETAAFECKQGLLGLDSARTANDELLQRLIETACGIANIGPESSGAIFIGVADDEKDADRIEQLDGVKAKRVGSRLVVGVDRELAKMKTDLEKYKKKVIDAFSKSALSEPLKASVLGTIDCIEYRGMSVVTIWIPAQKKVSDVNDVVFVREGSSTKRIQGFKVAQAIAARFD